MSADARAIARATITGKKTVVGTGAVRNHKLTLKLRHLHRGRYKLTLIELRPHHKPLVIGQTTLTVS